jgi:hypothetical protein
MSEEELRAYVGKLERALGAVSQENTKVNEQPWLPDEKRWVMIPRAGTNPVTINGKAYVGRQYVTEQTWQSIQEIHNKAVQSELARMQSRGNLVAPHLLPLDDVSSRRQPVTIASLS